MPKVERCLCDFVFSYPLIISNCYTAWDWLQPTRDRVHLFWSCPHKGWLVNGTPHLPCFLASPIDPWVVETSQPTPPSKSSRVTYSLSYHFFLHRENGPGRSVDYSTDPCMSSYTSLMVNANGVCRRDSCKFVIRLTEIEFSFRKCVKFFRAIAEFGNRVTLDNDNANVNFSFQLKKSIFRIYLEGFNVQCCSQHVEILHRPFESHHARCIGGSEFFFYARQRY